MRSNFFLIIITFFLYVSDFFIPDKSMAENRLRPLKGLISTGYGARQIILLALAAALILIIIIAAYFFFKYRRNRKSCLAVPTLSPYDRGLNRIDALVAPGISDGDGGRAFCFMLSEILREYMGAIRGFNALEMTTHEIAGVVKNKDDLALLNLLKRMDLVKFAGVFMSSMVLEEQATLARAYIDQTRPEET